MATGLSVPAQLVLDPFIDLSAETNSVETIFKGPVSKAPLEYNADSWSDASILFQNVTPSSTETVLGRSVDVRYSFYVGYVYTDVANQKGAGVKNGTCTIDPLPAHFEIDDAAVRARYLASSHYASQYSKAFHSSIVTPRSLPLNSCARNIDFKINGSAIPFNSMEIAPLWSLTQADEGLSGWNSTYPFGNDQGVVQLATDGAGIGSEFSPYDQSGVRGWRKTRAQQRCTMVAFTEAVEAGTATTNANFVVSVLFRYDVVEPIIVPPLRYGDSYEYAGISRVVNLTIAMTLQNISRMICLDASTTIRASSFSNNFAAGQLVGLPKVTLGQEGVSVTTAGQTFYSAAFTLTEAVSGGMLAAPSLQIMYAVPDAVTLRTQPQFCIYPYELYQFFTQPISLGLTAGQIPMPNQIWRATSPAIRMATIPSRIYVFAQPSVAAKQTVSTSTTPGTIYEPVASTVSGFHLTDHGLNIASINVQFLERVGQFTTYSATDLYKMSNANGYRGSQWDWLYRTGSLVILDTNSDICLAPREADGQNVVATFQINVEGNFQVQSMARQRFPSLGANVCNIDYTLYVVATIPGKVIIGGGQSQVVTEGPNQSQVLSLLQAGASALHPKDLRHNSVASAGNASGGGLLSWMGRVGRWARKRVAGLADKLITPENMTTLANAVRQRLAGPAEPAQPMEGEEQSAQPTGGAMVAGRFKRRMY